MVRRAKVYRKKPQVRKGRTLYTQGYKKPVLSSGAKILKMYTTNAFSYRMIERDYIKRSLNIRKK